MKSLHYKRLIFFVVFLSCALIAGKCIMLSRINFSMDDLALALKPLENFIHPGSSIGYVSDGKAVEDVKEYLEIKDVKQYLELKYTLAPDVLLYNVKADTILVVEDNSRTSSIPNGYKVLCQTHESKIKILLLSKSK